MHPKKGNLVSVIEHGIGIVVKISEDRSRTKIHFFGNGDSSWLDSGRLACGFSVGDHVFEQPTSTTLPPLGEGVVRQLRKIGGTDQVLVDFCDTGEARWIPWNRLRYHPDLKSRALQWSLAPKDMAERARLKLLAHAILRWESNSGALSQMGIDPLPHQVQLVHHILESGSLNWLIADDVGLGKTIEVGMLLKALFLRKRFKRVLIVTPASLTLQWQEELFEKFGFEEFVVLNHDFFAKRISSWDRNACVIASIDSLKQDDRLELLLQGPDWDLVIFDEAHRLSRSEVGRQFHSSDRFRLASKIRTKTDNLLLLSATPHQGKSDKFRALLELIRPEWRHHFYSDEEMPDAIHRCVYRNRKSECVDHQGSLLFKGKTVTTLQLQVDAEEVEFERSLQQYFERGYSAANRLGEKGRAIGFVMTTYRKIATSSIFAVLVSLERRLARLKVDPGLVDVEVEKGEEAEDERFAGELLEGQLGKQVGANEFFDKEVEMLERLIAKGNHFRDDESKVRYLMNSIRDQIQSQNKEEKVVIFTEFRSTQDRLIRALEEEFGLDCCRQINGGQKLEEKINSVKEWKDKALFLVSTEAGSEGINLQDNCHIMVNFDLPWNPMRLVQRMGRLDRYGQKKRVSVFNLAVQNFADHKVLNVIYSRLDSISHDLGELSRDFSGELEGDVLGSIAEISGGDIEKILEASRGNDRSRTEQEIEEAIQRARGASKLQEEIFSDVQGFDQAELSQLLSVDEDHVMAFLKGVFQTVGISEVTALHDGRAVELTLPKDFPQISGLRRNFRVTPYRELARRFSTIEFLDTSHPLLKYLLTEATKFLFGGGVVAFENGSDELQHLRGAILRWQDEQGVLCREELVLLDINKEGYSINGNGVRRWLKSPATQGDAKIERPIREKMLSDGDRILEELLMEKSNDHLFPAQVNNISLCWCEGDSRNRD
jgi:ERCC4-related helicase